ncbi:cytochrome c biogenesis protein CcdA [Microbacterium horticulturae]|uniref:Cytochrome c biogenesis protein CcdA n=1 Tax=Microbacterium horticulturae TaxID=3028316 RepID=A0ABY8BZ15_9MICO|nr:cytochrome c biogenesis protein CcdA [Microbacterium sp. KACC 23027]WEG08235.1 cytochrome c biogenesis protein CcdA [Microbacterium sp. KACC 23027]
MTAGTVGFAFVMGMVALLNPCGLPLLPVYLVTFVGGADRRGAAWRVRAGVRAGLGLTTGFLAVFCAAAVLIGSLHALLLSVLPMLMIGVAAVIVVVGALALAGRPLSFHLAARFGGGTGLVAMVGFGIAYAAGSLSCALPVFAAAVGGALSSGSSVQTVAVIIAYGLGMGLLATVLAFIAAFAGGLSLGRIRRAAAALPRVAGALCVVIGLYLIGFWVGQAGGPQLVAPVTEAIDVVQQALAGLIEDAWMPLGAALLTVVVAALLLSAQRARRRAAASPHPLPGED